MMFGKIIGIGPHRNLLREIAHGVKDGSAKYADMAARLFDRMLPPDCVVVPMPGHGGQADTMLDVALRLARISRRKVHDALVCNPHESSYEQKRRGLKPTHIAMWTNAVLCGKICIIDNCVASGVTASAALGAIPTACVCALTTGNHWRNQK